MPSAAAAPAPPAISRRLDANPLFVDGSNYDEFQLSAANVDFAAARLGLDPTFVALVKSAPAQARFSAVYHSDAGGTHLDAYRVAAAAGKHAVFSAYHVVDPSFDPGKTYVNEKMTALSPGNYFGTLVVSKRLAVPDSTDAALRSWLAANGYEGKETVPFGQLEHPRNLKDFFGLRDSMGVQMYDLQKKSFAEKFKIFYQLCKESPEYCAYKVGDVLDEIGSAMLLGVITPELWKQGTAYGIASTISSIGNIGSPAIGIVGESFLGSVVDKAVNSERPIENLKKITLGTGTLRAIKTGATFALHPQIITALGSHPGAAFIGLYATATVLGSVAGVVSGKADFAIHDQLINKGTLRESDYSKNFYQILGVEASLSRALYLGSYSATVAAVSAFPGASLAIAGTGAALWAASNFVWPLYHEKPEVRTTVEASAFIHEGDRYRFDSGWEVSFKGGKGRIVQEDARHFSIDVQDGDLTIKNDRPGAIGLQHQRRLKDYLPTFLKPKALGEKEHWELSNGGDDQVSVSRYGNDGYHLNRVSDSEYVVTRS